MGRAYRPRRRHLLVGAGLIGVALWQARAPLATGVADLYLRRHGVESRYEVERLSPAGLVLTGVALGPETAPDFTADRVEIAFEGLPLAPRVAALRLVAPELRVSLVGGRPSFGALDALLPEPSREPAPLPDTRVRIEGGRLRATLPTGDLAFRIAGSGRLSDGFSARADLEPGDPSLGSCRLGRATGRLLATTAPGRLAVRGTGTMGSAACGSLAAHRLAWAAEAVADTGFERIRGSASLSAERLRDSTNSVGSPSLRIAFTGGPERWAGTWRAGLGAGRGPSGTFDRAEAGGSFAADPAAARFEATGELRAEGLRTTLPVGFADTAPRVLAALASRAAAAARRFDLAASVALRLEGGGYDLVVPRLLASSATGARLSLTDGTGVRLTDEGLRVDGTLRAEGGGLPRTTARFDAFDLGERTGGRLRLRAEPWRAAGATLAVPDLTVRRSADGLRARARLNYAGPLGATATVRGLEVAVAVVGDAEGRTLRMDAPCAAIAFAELASGDARLDATRLRLCRLGGFAWAGGRLVGGLGVAPLRLTGRSAGRPLSLTTGEARLSMVRGSVRLAPVGLAAAFGPHRLEARLDGEIGADGSTGSGRIVGLSLSGPDLPVRIDAGQAKVAMAGGAVRFAGIEARVSDALPAARFQPLRVADATARLVDGRIEAGGAGRLAASGERLFGFELRHDLASSTGSADLATGPLLFSDRLQPYEITEALRGVVENVAGRVDGTGTVRWAADALDSDGRVVVRDVSLATAALGPVTGIEGTVLIDDLFALTTPPAQVVTVASMNPGVLVEDGRFEFRMLGPTSARVEDARWPFAGGTLTLRPVTITAGEARREFTLDVAGIDAGLFLQRFELANVNATGAFDGKLPLVFQDGAGRVVGGTLDARPGGGLIQYVGEVGADSMGAAGRLAFDALKRLRYRSLSMTLDGDLDGELVTAVRFAGTNEAPVRPAGAIPVRASGLPFRFNVTVRAPFRGLLGTAASFSDAREMIRSAAPPETPAAGPAAPADPVQRR